MKKKVACKSNLKFDFYFIFFLNQCNETIQIYNKFLYFTVRWRERGGGGND